MNSGQSVQAKGPDKASAPHSDPEGEAKVSGAVTLCGKADLGQASSGNQRTAAGDEVMMVHVSILCWKAAPDEGGLRSRLELIGRRNQT